MKTEDFTRDAPGKLVKIPHPQSEATLVAKIEASPIHAFSPNALPPTLRYDGELVSLLGRVSLTLGRLDERLRELPNPNIVIRPLQRHEALESSRIEGTIADLDQIALFQADPTASQANPDAVREVANYVQALSWGIAQMEHRSVTTSFIKELHALLLDGVVSYRHERGALRAMQAIIGTPGRSISHARFVPPPPHDVPGLLFDLERFIADPGDVPPLIRLALTHYQFETIHPFPDGNGRVGRMLIPMLMRAWGIMRLPHVDFSAYVAPRREVYLDRLLSVSQRGEWRPWITFVLEGLEHQGAATLGIARDLLALRENLVDILRDGVRTQQPGAVADYLLEHASITTKQLQALAGVTATPAQRQIDELVRRGIVREATGRQRDRVYVADIVLNVFQSTE